MYLKSTNQSFQNSHVTLIFHVVVVAPFVIVLLALGHFGFEVLRILEVCCL